MLIVTVNILYRFGGGLTVNPNSGSFTASHSRTSWNEVKDSHISNHSYCRIL